ncbi:hypothetical protein UK82_22250 [Frankia sp. ACN1ag]|nr:hypothetical protein UK82_22250 [Frankia sp. ACN1ag]
MDRCGMTPENIVVCHDPGDPISLADTIGNVARQADDVFLMWYLGHGVLGSDRGLHLATAATAEVYADFRSLPYRAVGEVLLETCAAKSIVMVLDTCHAGGAASSGPLTGRLPAPVGRSGRGSFLLAAASEDERALAPVDADHTAFTGAVLRVLVSGDEQAGPTLTLDRVARVVARDLAARRYPPPQWWSSIEIGDLVLADNPAFIPPTLEPDSLPPRPRRYAADGTRISPYPGLRRFDVDDAAFFHGRRESCGQLLARVNDRLRGAGPLFVVGASGSGKSSLVRAGLLPALARGDAAGGASSSWPAVVLTPGSDPVAALAAALAGPSATGGDVREAGRRIRADPVAAVELARRMVSGAAPEPEASASSGWLPGRSADGRLVIVVDQFEELFTQCADPQTHAAVLAALVALSAAQDTGAAPVAIVVLVVRTDFLDQTTGHPELADALASGLVMVQAMSRAEVREAIEEPARVAGLALERGLVDLLLLNVRAAGAEQGYDAGALPLLAHTLYETWRRREGRMLTVAGYGATGGVAAAVSRSAEEVYERLDEDGRRIVRQVLVRLVRSEDYTRRRVSHAAVVPGGQDAAVVWRVVDALAAARLVTIGEDEVEITHEALLRGWPRLRRWVTADRGFENLQQEIEADAARWADESESPDLLYRGRALAAAQVGLAGRELSDPRSAAFIRASERHAVRVARRRTAIVASLVVLSLLLAGVTVAAVRQQRLTAAQKADAISGRLTALAGRVGERDAVTALKLGVAANGIHADTDSRTGLAATVAATGFAGLLPGHTGPVRAVVAFPRQPVVATGSEDGTVRVWDVRDQDRPRPLRAPLPGGVAKIRALALSPDGKLLAVGGTNGLVTLWRIDPAAQAHRVADVASGIGAVFALAFAPAGARLLVGGSGGDLALWDLTTSGPEGDVVRSTRTASLVEHKVAVNAVAFEPGGAGFVAAADDGEISLWRFDGHPAPTLRTRFLTDGGSLRTVAFADDGNLLVYGGVAHEVKMIDFADRSDPDFIDAALTGFTDRVSAVAFLPGERTLITTSHDRALRRWDLTTPGNPRPVGNPIFGHNGAIWALAVSADGRMVTTASDDRTAMRWDLRAVGAPRPIGAPLAGGSGAADVSMHGHLLATASRPTNQGGRGGLLWDIDDPARPVLVAELDTGGAVALSGPRFSGDGKRLVARAATAVILWDLRDPHRPRRLVIHDDATKDLYRVAISRDGRRIAAVGWDRSVTVWNVVGDGSAVHRLGVTRRDHTDNVYGAAFAPDGHTLATGSADHHVILWDLDAADAPRRRAVLSGSTGSINGLTFSPDGRLLATGSGDRTIRLWDVRDPSRPRQLGQPIAGHTSMVAALAFSPDGALLASGSYDGTVRLWDVRNLADLPTVAIPLEPIGSPLLDVSITSDGASLVTATLDGPVRVWDLTLVTRLLADPVPRICTLLGGGLPPEDWKIYVPDLKYRRTCPQ